MREIWQCETENMSVRREVRRKEGRGIRKEKCEERSVDGNVNNANNVL